MEILLAMGMLRHLRRYPRVRLESQVAIYAGGRLGLAFGTDIGEGGVGLYWPMVPPEEGKEVQLVFYLPTRDLPLHVRGLVVNVRRELHSYAFGVMFSEMPTGDLLALRRYVNMRRFLYRDMRVPSSHPEAGERMRERLNRLREKFG